jgi:hypothetical protein
VCYPPLTNESKRDIYLSPRCWWTSPARSSYHITVTQLSTTPAIRSGLGWRVAQHKLGRKYICCGRYSSSVLTPLRFFTLVSFPTRLSSVRRHSRIFFKN